MHVLESQASRRFRLFRSYETRVSAYFAIRTHSSLQAPAVSYDDIVEGVIRVLDHPAQVNPKWDGDKPDPGTSKAPWRVYNIGNNQPIELMDYIGALEKALDKKAKMNLLPLQPGDIPDTYADVDDLVKQFDYKPATRVEKGVAHFVDWYRNYFNI